MLETIIFAVDGVIAETHEARREAFNDVFDEAGVGWHWDRACYAQLLRGARGQELGACAMIGAFIGQRVVRPRHLGDLSNMIVAMERRHAVLLRERFKSRRVQLRSGIASFIQAAASERIGLAIMTHDDGENVRMLLDACLPIETRAAIEVIALPPHGDVADRPNAYSEATALLDADSHGCLVVESSVQGLADARAAGVTGVMTWGLYPRMDEIVAPLPGTHTSSVADASSFFLSRWDCAPPRELLSYIRDVHGMQSRLLHRMDVFIPPTATLDKEVNNAGLRYLEA
jgi:beta-phosphoglucomutase-like phosphatase (HAD superfamily)